MGKSSSVSWLAKLTPKQVVEIRKLRLRGWSQTQLAKRFDVSQPTISNLLLGKTYRGLKRQAA